MKKTTKKIIASALAAAMVMASSVMTFADEATGYEEITKCNVSSKMTVEEVDGAKVATVTISISGDDCRMFDLGLMYDADTMQFVSCRKTPDFDEAYSTINGSVLSNDQKDQSYVVIGATCTADEFSYDGEALLVKFNVKGDEATPINVVKDSKYILDAYNASGATGTLADFLASDKAPADAPKPSVVEPEVPEDPTTPPTDPTDDPNNNTNNGDNNNTNTDNNNTNNNTDNNNNANNNGTQGTTTTTAPATTAPSAAANKAKSPKTGDAGVVLPIVAICGAAAAVVVASKKKVED